MNDKVVFHPLKGKQITKSQKMGTPQVLMLLKHKRCREIKGRAVADRRKQIT